MLDGKGKLVEDNCLLMETSDILLIAGELQGIQGFNRFVVNIQ